MFNIEILASVIAVVLLFFLVGSLLRFFKQFLCEIFGYNLELLTFLGVIHHELSHALVGFLLGEKITKIVLFKPNREEGTLGYVEGIPRGPLVLRSLQVCLMSTAPMYCGALTIYALYMYAWPAACAASIGWQILVGYLMLSVFMHMTMSWQDCTLFIKFSPCFILILYIIFLYYNINLMTYLPV